MAVARRPTSRGLLPGRGVSIEAAASAQLHEQASPCLSQGLRQLEGIVASVKDRDRHWPVRIQSLADGSDLLPGDHVRIVARSSRRRLRGVLQLSGAKLSWAIHWLAHPPTIGCPAEWHDGW